MTDPLGDVADASFTVTGAQKAQPSPTGWTVVVDAAGEPVSAFAPGATEAAPEIVVADARMPVDVALGLHVLRDLAPDGAVVCVDGARRVVGVWAGHDLADALMLGALRHSDVRLPGRIAIPRLTRLCQFAGPGTRCGTPLSWPERPETMPPCPNASGLADHTFVW